MRRRFTAVYVAQSGTGNWSGNILESSIPNRSVYECSVVSYSRYADVKVVRSDGGFSVSQFDATADVHELTVW